MLQSQIAALDRLIGTPHDEAPVQMFCTDRCWGNILNSRVYLSQQQSTRRYRTLGKYRLSCKFSHNTEINFHVWTHNVFCCNRHISCFILWRFWICFDDFVKGKSTLRNPVNILNIFILNSLQLEAGRTKQPWFSCSRINGWLVYWRMGRQLRFEWTSRPLFVLGTKPWLWTF
jgi:hypothetical protein